MKTNKVISFLLVLFLIGIVSAEIRINEVELNPAGSSDSGNEWIELYSDNLINMTSWIITSINGRNMSFNITFSGYYLLNTTANLLTDSSNTLILKNNSNAVIFSTGSFSDAENDERTWEYCPEGWLFLNSTKGIVNNCTQPVFMCIQNWNCSGWSSCLSNSQTRTCSDLNNCGNNTGKPSESQSCTLASYIELNWTREIFSNEEFDIEVKFYNLLSQNYDVKVWIQFEDNSTIISETYDTGDDDWNSGTYYVADFISGPGNKTKDIQLRLKEDYTDSEGEAKIFAKLRYNGNIIDEFEKKIIISYKEIQTVPDSTPNTTSLSLTQSSASDINSSNSEEDIIVLSSSKNKTENNGTKSIRSIKIAKPANSIIYKSKMEYIKDYAPYLLCAVCIFIIILLMIDKKAEEKRRKK